MKKKSDFDLNLPPEVKPDASVNADFVELFRKLPFLRLPRFVVLWIMQRNSFSSNLYRVYVYMLYHANFVDGVMHVQGIVYPCKKGELVVTRGQIGKLLGLDRSTVSLCVSDLQKKGLISSRLMGRVTCFAVRDYALMVAGSKVGKGGKGSGAANGAAGKLCNDRSYEREERRPD